MARRFRSLTAAAVGAWLALVLVALVTRPLLPVDETRYLSVAWEMWNRGDWLVPHLNGAPYSDKPPLLFWLILAGWRVLGVNAWWPRLIGPLGALGSVALSVALAGQLWPGRPAVARATPAFLFVAVWAAYATFVLFDLPLTGAVLLGILGIVTAWRGRMLGGWTLTGLALGVGILAKGPIALLHILPVGLLAPWWARDPRPRSWAVWYAGLVAAVAVGAALALAWALPAAARGGPAYGDAILWHQTADRMVNAFAHRRPLWWYLPLLPALLFPWGIWPPFWSGVRRLWNGGGLDSAARLCVAWLAAVLVGLALISGKQVHYLIPVVPAFALLAARATADDGRAATRRDAIPPALGLVIVAAALVALGAGAFAERLPSWATHIAPWWALPLAAGAAALLALRGEHQRVGLAVAASGMLLVVHAGVVAPARGDLDLTPAGAYFGSRELAGNPIAHVGRYAGQYHFLGRLRAPFEILPPDSVAAWAVAHPTGLVACLRRTPGAGAGRPAYHHPYLDRDLLVYPAPAATGCTTPPPPSPN